MIGKTIRSRLLLATIASGLVPVAILSFTSRTMIGRAIEASVDMKYEDLGQELSRQVSLVMERASADLRSLQTNPKILSPTSTMDEREDEMRRLVEVYNLFDDISLYDPNGDMIISTHDDFPEPRDYTSWFKNALAGEIQISTPQPAIGTPNKLFLSAYYPIGGGDGAAVDYVVRARLPFSSVWDVLDGFSSDVGSYAILLDDFGNVISHRNKSNIFSRFDGGSAQELWGDSNHGVYESEGGGRFLYSTNTLAASKTQVGQEWLVMTLVPESIVTDLLDRSNFYHFIAGLVTLLVAVGAGAVISRPIARSMFRAASVANHVASGNTTARIPEEGPREMKRLAATFNEMVAEVDGHRRVLIEEVKEGTEKLRVSERELELASAQIRAAFESTREAVLIIRNDGVVIAANDRLRTFFNLPGRDLVWGDFAAFEKSFFGCFEEPALMKAHWKDLQMNMRDSRDAEWAVISPKPLSITSYAAPVRDDDGEIVARLWMFEDLTKQKELQKGLEQAQKMEAIGRLAGGVAHDFNNLLTGIIGNLSLAQMTGGIALEESGGAPFVSTAKTAAERAASLVKQLLGFSRRNHLTLEACNVNDIIKEVCELLSHTFDPRVEIATDKAADLWGVKVDPAQVQQVVMNMCVNARDAMPEGGLLTLATNNVEVGISEAALHDAVAGEYVRLTVSDSGQGIPKELIDKIFEPFFTTKEPGKGTGLGLATSYGIVQQHGGWIECESEKGNGAAFSIFLPKADVVSNGREALPEGGFTKAGGLAKMGETILLIDDERVVRTVAESVLAHAGFKTLSASDGVEGVEMVRSHGDDIALVILDLTMPKMSGSDTLRVIRQVRPELPVVICSGYLLDLDDFADEVGIRPEGLIQKPYKVAELPVVVRGVIDRNSDDDDDEVDEGDIPGRGEAVGGDDGIALRS